jgi:hypothetical protein
VATTRRSRSSASLARARIVRVASLAASLVVSLAALSVSVAQDESSPVAESTVKAAFLYKFAAYVQWPANAPGSAAIPVRIGVFGASDFAHELSQITQGRTVNDRPIDVRRLMDGDGFDNLDILFIGDAENNRLQELLAAVRGQPILTVTETKGALSDGSIINFTTEQQRVRFEVSLHAAEQSRLQLYSRLLAVASAVQRRPE